MRERKGVLLTVVKISVATFLAEDEETADEGVKTYGKSAGPPNHRVSDEVNLLVVLNPEVLYFVVKQ